MNTQPQSSPATRRALVWLTSELQLDLQRGQLLRNGEEVKLRPKAFQTLQVLVENDGRLLAKGELLERLWPGSITASEDSLAHCIMEVRKALGGAGQTLVRTVPGRGYIFERPPELDNTVLDKAVVVPEAPRPRRAKLAALLAILLLMLAIGMGILRWRQVLEARDLSPKVETLTEQGRFAEAFEAANRVLAADSSDTRVNRLLNEFSDDLTVTTEPSGAVVSLQRLGSSNEQEVGVTPITRLRIARGEYVIRLRREGYEAEARTISSSLSRSRPIIRTPWNLVVSQTMRPIGKSPMEMVYVPKSGPYSLRSYERPSELKTELSPYYIDRYEVSNADFQAFIDSGGYRRAEFWDQAMEPAKSFTDKTGLAGPRDWSGGKYPVGKERYPVSHVSWEEARAYCVSKGKDLPTVFQWEFAARATMETPFAMVYPWGPLKGAEILQRANLESTSARPVDSMPFGMSPFGVYNMAGNVAEWFRNAFGDGHGSLGGSWRSMTYEFYSMAWHPKSESSDAIGFRCALVENAALKDAGAFAIARMAEPIRISKASPAEFAELKAEYAFERNDLEARIESVRENAIWRREEVSFNGYGDERASGYLYLPRNAKPPYQVIEYLGGSGHWNGVPVTIKMEGSHAELEPYVKLGRAIFLVNLKGFAGREPVGGYARLDAGTTQYRSILKWWLGDISRGLDYLQSRPDIDARKTVFWSMSTTDIGGMAAALEDRYAGVILSAAGLNAGLEGAPREVNMHLFAPYIRATKLMLNGSYDEWNPPDRSATPFYQILSAPKKRVQFTGGHVPAPEIAVPIISSWLDAVLGPVQNRK